MEIGRPFLSLEVDILSGDRDPLGIGFLHYTIRGVKGERTVYGPPSGKQSEGLVSKEDKTYWYWDVPLSLQACFANTQRNDVPNNSDHHKTTETMAIFFQPQKPLSETRTNPTLCYFGQKGLLWRKQVPIKEAVATLPDQDTITYDVVVTNSHVQVSADGKFIWVIGNAVGKRETLKKTERTYNTFVFIYNDTGKLTKTLFLPNSGAMRHGNAPLLDSNAFLMHMGGEVIVVRTDGVPLYRLPKMYGWGWIGVDTHHDGRKIRVRNAEKSKDDPKQYTYYFDLSEKDVALAKPQ